MITRRTLLSVCAAAVLAPRGPVLAQQRPARTARIGYLTSGTGEQQAGQELFIAGMREHGYIVGKNLLLEARYADTRLDRLPALAAELVAFKPDVIVAVGTIATDAVRRVTSSIPIVMLQVGDPVGSGLVKSLRQPGGNITGTTGIGAELIRKHLDLALQLFPGVPRVGVLLNPDNPNHRRTVAETSPHASKLNVDLVPAPARNLEEIRDGFAAMSSRGVRVVIVRQDTLFSVNGREIAQLALKNGMSVVAQMRGFVAEGCLLSYGPVFADLYKRGAHYVDRILKGAKPANLPVEQPTAYELHLNLKTAKALGITIPPSLLVQATGVIE